MKVKTGHKRQYREMDDATKKKISDALKNKAKSKSHRQSISAGLKKYWKEVPHRTDNAAGNQDSDGK